MLFYAVLYSQWMIENLKLYEIDVVLLANGNFAFETKKKRKNCL